MAKKDKKKSKKKDTPGADAVGAVRTAVERTFQATADSAQSTRTRAQDLVDEVAHAAARVREMVEQLGVLEDLKKQVDSLTRRVQALEGGKAAAKSAVSGGRSKASRAKSSGSTGRAKTASSSSQAKRSSSRSTASKPASSSRAKPATSKSRSSAAKRSSSTKRSSSAKQSS